MFANRNRIPAGMARGSKPVLWPIIAILASCVALMLGASGCTFSNGPSTGEVRTISKSVPLGQQKSVVVDIKMGAGKLRVAGGTTDLMNADFTYNVDSWKPAVHYDMNGGQGHLTIQQPSGSHNHPGGTRYDWDVRLNAQVPMQMNVNMGAGKADLILAGLNLSRVNVNMGAGEADIDLDGRWTHDVQASVQGGVGKAVLNLPQDVGVRATVQGGLGAIKARGFSKNGNVYTNDVYGKSPVNLDIDVQGGLGEVDLVLGGGHRTI